MKAQQQRKTSDVPAQMLADFKYAFRQLIRRPGFTLSVVATLALCIGANTSVVSVLYGLVLKPLPFRDPGQLVEIYNSYPKTGQAKRPTSVVQYLDFKAHADLFSGIFLWRDAAFTFGEETGPTRITAARVSADAFDVFGVHPYIGRFYTVEDSALGRDHLLVLTRSFWEAHYQADPAIIGKSIKVDGLPYTVIGVAPRSMESFDRIANFFKPFEYAPTLAAPQYRGALDPSMFARLKPGVSAAQAASQLSALEQEAYRNAPPAMRTFLDRSGHRVEVGRVQDQQIQAIRSSLLLLQAGVALVLLLGCMNVANLMLARANGRQAEFAIRQALGAGPGALARPLLSEALLLALAGAVVGLALARASLVLINDYITRISHTAQPVGLDGTILGVTLLVSLLVALVIGVLPAVRIWNANLLGAMQGGARGASGSGSLRAVSGLLVTAQVSFALILLVGAGLLIQSFKHVLDINPGFDARRVLHVRVAGANAYQAADKRRWLEDQIISRMKEIPGVENVALSVYTPVGGAIPVRTLPLRGDTSGATDTYPSAYLDGVTPDFFDVMGIRIIQGRGFTASTAPNSRPEFMVDRAFATKYFAGRNAVGHGINLGGSSNKESDWPLLVGIVENAAFNGPEDRSGIPYVYWSFNQEPVPGFSILIRTDRPLDIMLPLMRAKLNTVDPSLPMYTFFTLQTGLDDLLANRRGVMMLLGAFAVLALVLAAVGIYGMLAYDVTLRTREIGIRGAIGADRGQILGLILRQGLVKAAVGLVVGLAGAFYLTHFMRSLLFNVQPADPLAYAAVSLLLLGVSLIASYLPARRAARIDPMTALRCD